MKHKDTFVRAAKIAGVTCLTMGAIAVVSSGAAVNGAMAGFRYVGQSVKKILSAENNNTNAGEAVSVTQ